MELVREKARGSREAKAEPLAHPLRLGGILRIGGCVWIGRLKRLKAG